MIGADFAVGAGGTILYYDGTNRSAQVSGMTSDLSFVGVLDALDAYAVGASRTVLHYDGTRWSPIPISGLTVTLRAADVAVSATGIVTDYFVVGDGGTILHSSDGVNWSPQPSGTANALFGVSVISKSDAFAVGALGTILHYDGTAWTQQR